MNDNHATSSDDQRRSTPPQAGEQPPPQAQQPPPPPPPPPPGAPVHDDVWGVRPPVLGQQPGSAGAATPQDTPATHQQSPVPGQSGYGYGYGYGQQGTGPQAGGPGTGPGSSSLDRGLSALQRSPLRRDTSAGIIGGVAAGIARRMNVSPAAVRLAFVALALFFGSGIAAYLIAWALLPDESGRTHVEQGIKGGNAQSLIVTVLGGLAALGMLSSLLDGMGWLVPIAVTAGIVWYVVSAGRKKGDGTA